MFCKFNDKPEKINNGEKKFFVSKFVGCAVTSYPIPLYMYIYRGLGTVTANGKFVSIGPPCVLTFLHTLPGLFSFQPGNYLGPFQFLS
jgi:hypothetical protein